MVIESNIKEIMFKEVDIVQDIIKRMANNSFMIKGWSITIISFILLLKGSPFQVFISFLPLFTFWYLDAFFLHKEKCYRKLYDFVVQKRLINSEEKLLDMNYTRFEKDIDNILNIMFSKTLSVFYLTLFILLDIYIIIYFTQIKGI